MSSSFVVAAFDFDGTITRTDTTIPFLVYAVGPFWGTLYLLTLLPSLFLWGIGRSTREETKERMLTRFLAKVSYTDLQKKADLFVEHKLSSYLRPHAMERVKWHKAKGHRLILISASLDVVLSRWGKKEGFDDVLATRLEVDGQKRITGKILGKNCRGFEKKLRLAELLGERQKYKIYAYGDSDGDKELLEFADYPFYRYIPSETGE